MIKFYDDDYKFELESKGFKTQFEVIDNDTFTVASNYDNACCLNFASQKRPGGGYAAVQDLRMPIKTQEEDLFRRSNLPAIMDTEEIIRYYPLNGIQGFYCDAMVDKDKILDPIIPFKTSLVTVPAVINPNSLEKLALVKQKIERILAISANHNHEILLLGAWGCGAFNNDPLNIANLFKELLTGKFSGVFKKVIFTVPGKTSYNHKVFAATFS